MVSLATVCGQDGKGRASTILQMLSPGVPLYNPKYRVRYGEERAGKG